MSEMARLVRYRAGVPIYRYRTTPQTPPVSVLRFDADTRPGRGQRHIHDFPVLAYVERAGQMVMGDPPCPMQGGDVYVVAAGKVIDRTVVNATGSACGVFFDPTALGGDGQVLWSSWRSHPLLFPFLHGIPGGLLRLHVPPAQRPVWTATIAAIETETGRPRCGSPAGCGGLPDAAAGRRRTTGHGCGGRPAPQRRAPAGGGVRGDRAAVHRIAVPARGRRDRGGDAGLPDHAGPAAHRAHRHGLDHRTRMVQVRQLLTETDLPVSEVARRVGIPDAGYFARVFRHSNEVPPRAWRHAAAPANSRRPAPPQAWVGDAAVSHNARVKRSVRYP